jgi:hypothetical protein
MIVLTESLGIVLSQTRDTIHLKERETGRQNVDFVE